MIRRIAIACIAVVALMGATDAVAKRKKPKLKVGDYVGTTSNGIQMTVTLNPGRTSGAIYYCAMTATLTVTGKSFAVFYQDPVSLDTINASGTFKAKRRRSGSVKGSVFGTIEPNGCDASPQTFALRHP